MSKSYEGKNLLVLPKWAQDHIQDLKSEIDRLQAIKDLYAILSDRDRDWFPINGPEKYSNRKVIKLWVFNRDDPFLVATLYPGDRLFVGRGKGVEHGSNKSQETVEQKSQLREDEIGTILQQGSSTRNDKRARSKK